MYRKRTIVKVVGIHALLAGVLAAAGTVAIDLLKLFKADVI